MKNKKFISILIVLVILIVVLICWKVNEKKKEEEKELQEEQEWRASSFDLRDKIPYREEYQIPATHRSCWAYAALDSIETNLMLQKGKEYDFSEIHVEYMTSTLLGGDRTFDTTGGYYHLFEKIGKEYPGPVLETQVPNRRYQENEFDLLRKAKPIVKEVEFVNFNFSDTNYDQEVIKRHLVKYGSIYARNLFQFIPIFYQKETKGYCNRYIKEFTHTVSIIGWDDNYPKENFPEENRPEKDGAYLVNSFSKGEGKDTIVYVSYEDAMIHDDMRGIIDCKLYW